ncbi:MAG: EamA-like transporter family protein [bacterium ADurb.Bin400]|nr:MAG: EamA-like transporter family protein [bacterium ADurb.Bin400]
MVVQVWMVYALLSALFAALVAIFGKVGISTVDSTLATTVRAVIMAGFLVAVSLLLGKAHLLSTIQDRAWLWIVLSGIAGALSWLFYFLALKGGPATGVVAIDRLSIAFVLVLSILFLAEHLTLKAVVGIVLVIAGAIMLSVK